MNPKKKLLELQSEINKLEKFPVFNKMEISEIFIKDLKNKFCLVNCQEYNSPQYCSELFYKRINMCNKDE